MAKPLFGQAQVAWLPRPWRKARGRVAGGTAERAYRLTAALAERQAAQDARRRRWGALLCHMRNDPYDDWLSPTRKRP